MHGFRVSSGKVPGGFWIGFGYVWNGCKRLEQKGILTSIENLMTFPFISERVETKKLSLHAVILDISEGTIKQFDESSSCFVPV